MKKTLIALTVAAVAATSANAAVVYQQDGTKVEVGGSVRLVLSKTTDKRGNLEDNGSRIIIKGTHDLGEGLSVLGYSELGFAGELGSGGVTTRRLFAGFDHKDIGTLTFGKQVTTSDDFGVADPTYKFGGLWASFYKDGSDLTALKARIDENQKVIDAWDNNEKVLEVDANDAVAKKYKTDHQTEYNKAKADNTTAQAKYQKYKAALTGHFVDSADKVIKFKSASFSGVSFGASYVFGAAKKADYNNNAYNVGVFYDNKFGDVNVKAEAGYTHQNIDKASKAKSVKLAAGVGFSGLFFGVDYARTKVTNDKPVNAFQLGVNYQITDMAKVYSAFRHTKYDVVKEKGFAVGFGYKPHKQVDTFVEYNTFKATDLKRDNALYAGLRVHF